MALLLSMALNNEPQFFGSFFANLHINETVIYHKPLTSSLYLP